MSREARPRAAGEQAYGTALPKTRAPGRDPSLDWNMDTEQSPPAAEEGRPRPFEGALRSLSIRTRIILLTLTVGGLFVAFHTIQGYQDYERLRDEGVRAVHARAEAVATSISDLLWFGRTSLEGVASTLGPTLLAADRCEEDLRLVQATAPVLDNLLVASPEGTVLCSALPGRPDPGVDLSDRPWFSVVRSGEYTLGELYEGGTTGRWLVVLAVPVRDADGTVVGTLAGSIDLVNVQHIVMARSESGRTLLTVADGHRVIVARSEAAETWVGRSLPPAQVEGPSFTADGIPYTRSPDLDGVARVWGEATVPGSDWTAFVATPEAEVMSIASAAARRNAAWGAVLMLLLVAFGVWTYRGVGRPLEALAEGARRAAPGGGLPIPPNAPAEVTELAVQLNAAAEARLRAQMAERRARDRYRSMFEQAAVGIYLSDRDGRFLDVNPALVSMLGYGDAAELKQVGLAPLYADPAQRKQLLLRYGKANAFHNVEVEWVRKDGEPVLLRLTGSLESHPDDLRIFEVFVQDITRERALEETSRHQQKMEAIGRLAGGFAHEFNNLLTVIGVNMELVQEVTRGSTVEHEVDEVVRAAARGASLTNKLLAMSRKDRRRDESLDLAAVVAENQGILQRVAGEHVDVVLSLAPDTPHVVMDRGHAEQVLLNLTMNARDAIRGAGTVTLATRGAMRRFPGQGPSTGWAVLRVVDTGPGIEEAIAPFIFEPFYTTKAPGEGTGLGLAVVHGIVEQAGGFIEVVSSPGQGATFEVWLPRAEAVAEPRDPVAASSAAHRTDPG